MSNASEHIRIWPGTDMLVPSVTTILNVIDKPELDKWHIIQGIILARQNREASFDEILEDLNQEAEYRGSIGTMVHECIGNWHQNKPFPDSYAFPNVSQLVDIYVQWALENLTSVPEYIEQVGFAEMDGLRFCGIPDAGLVTLKPGTYLSINGTGQKLKEPMKVLMDYKTGKANQPQWQLQLTGYKQIVMQQYGIHPDGLVTVRINPDGVHVKLWEQDTDIFAATLKLWWWYFGTPWLEKVIRKGD